MGCFNHYFLRVRIFEYGITIKLGKIFASITIFYLKRVDMRTRWRGCLIKALNLTDQPKKKSWWGATLCLRSDTAEPACKVGQGRADADVEFGKEKSQKQGFKNLCCQLAPVSQSSASLKGRQVLLKQLNLGLLKIFFCGFVFKTLAQILLLLAFSVCIKVSLLFLYCDLYFLEN